MEGYLSYAVTAVIAFAALAIWYFTTSTAKRKTPTDLHILRMPQEPVTAYPQRILNALQKPAGESHSKARTVASFKEYAVDPAVIKSHSALQHASKAFGHVGKVAEMFTDKKLMKRIAKAMPDVVGKLGKLGNLAQLLGPAGLAVGVAFDLLAFTGLVPSEDEEVMKKLDEISNQLKCLSADVKSGFKELKALTQIVEPYNDLLATVEIFEESVVGVVNANFYDRLASMVSSDPPHEIIKKLKRIHNAVVGKGEFAGGPLFKLLIEAEIDHAVKEGELDEFIATTLMQFQGLLALEVRSVRMLRSFVAYLQEDLTYEQDLRNIIGDLAIQREKYDPFHFFEWYLNIKGFAGVFTLSPASDPSRHISFIDPAHPARVLHMAINPLAPIYATPCPKGFTGDPDAKGLLIITPHQNGTFMISSVEWPNRYMYMQSGPAMHANVLAWDGDPGPQGHWKLSMKDYDKRLFVLNPAMWPHWYMYMQGAICNHDVQGLGEDPKEQGYFTLTRVDKYTKLFDLFMNLKLYGGRFVLSTKEWPNQYMCVEDGNVSGSVKKGHHKRTFIFTPCDDGSFRITTKDQRGGYMYMENNWKGNVRMRPATSGSDGYWNISIIDFKTRVCMLSTRKWPSCYIYMQKNGNVRGSTNPGKQGHFILSPI